MKNDMKLGESRFWQALWKNYLHAPSVALCRVPELEYASSLNTDGVFLDHCCGDGFFGELAWGHSPISAGCDISKDSIEAATRLNIYGRLDVCDASVKLPYPSDTFDVVFNNSALEHIKDLDSALNEVSRVLKAGGEFAFNVLNHRYFEWWPLDKEDMQRYRDWQPFHHALTISEWTERLAKAGLEVISFQGYFDAEISRRFAKLDYIFSGYYIRNIDFKYVKTYLKYRSWMSSLLKWEIKRYSWETDPDEGAGYYIKTVKP
jgi:SAM-dependent methyltransferase